VILIKLVKLVYSNRNSGVKLKTWYTVIILATVMTNISLSVTIFMSARRM